MTFVPALKERDKEQLLDEALVRSEELWKSRGGVRSAEFFKSYESPIQ